MDPDPPKSPSFQRSITRWLSVRTSARAVDFYKSAFGAIEVFRLEDPSGGVVARLSVDGAEFWLSDESPEHGNFSPQSLGGGSVRMILVVPDPDAVFLRAIKGWCVRGFSSERGTRLASGACSRSVWAPLGDWASDRRLDPHLNGGLFIEVDSPGLST